MERATQTVAYKTTRRICFTYRIIQVADEHSEYVILIASPQQQWLCEHASVLRYTYIARLVSD
jgi:hypothetical protein